MTIRTRFAPSPTGYLHIGGARTALFSWLYARRHGGQFILRIEDTDRERSTDASVQAILQGMAWLGLDADEGPYYQTQRFDRYREVIQQLLEAGQAYYCYCSKERLENLRAEQMAAKQKPRYDGHCRNLTSPPADVAPVIRFRNPEVGQVLIDDLIKGQVAVDNKELDDLIIARSDGTPTYNLTVVVDDLDMRITHVIRGDDHLNNTPRQINILNALGADLPQYAHVPMILGADGKRLSKRHGAVSVMQYEAEGYLPEALLNYLVRLGWSHGDQEVFSRPDMIELFDLADVNKAASTFNQEKLIWLNQHYIKTLPAKSTASRLGSYLSRAGIITKNGPALEQLVEVQKERVKTLEEMAQSSGYFYQDFASYDEKAAKKNLKTPALEPLAKMREKLAGLTDWQASPIHGLIEETAGELELKMGKVAQPLRVAVVGGAVSPPIDITVELIGRERVLHRIDRALDYIKAQGEPAAP